jgi:glutamate dehydrogenase (NAD(P)+)
VENAAKTINLDSQTLDTLRGFKLDWGCDIEARMDDGSTQRFKAVRIWHRSPHVDQPYKGGIRFHPDVDADIMKAHAMEMSIKCWKIGLEWGGAKGGVAVDPTKHSAQELKSITEKLVDEMDERNILGPFRDVPAPDVGTNPKIMNWIRQRYAQRRRHREDARFAGVVTGKPVGYGFGGIPGRNEATGYGLVVVLERILGHDKFGLFNLLYSRSTIAIMGFGNVGSHVAKFIKAKFPHYFRIIAVSDVNGGVFNEEGLNINELIERMNATGSIINAPNTRPITNDELLELDCDILIPAALENVITSDNADRIKAKIILEGANGPTTPEADEILKSRNILVIPDILANAGGVTVSFFEWARNVSIRDERIPAPQTEEVLKRLNEIMVASTDGVIETAESYNTDLRNAAYITAIKRAAPLFRTKHLAE